MSINRWADKEDVGYTCNGILLSHEKELYNAICSNTDGPRDYHTKRNQKEKDTDFPGDSAIKTLPFNTGGAGSNPGQGVKIQHASEPKNQNIKQKQHCNKFNKDF